MKFDLLEVLNYIDPKSLTYEEWLQCGMALKYEGFSSSDWDLWSQNDPRHVTGECDRKWNTFEGTGITGATITEFSKIYGGWQPRSGTDKELDWDDGLNSNYIVIDKDWVEGLEVKQPSDFDPVKEITKYLETLFEASDLVGYVTESWYNEQKEKHLPTQGSWSRLVVLSQV